MPERKHRWCKNPLAGEVSTFLEPGQAPAEGGKAVCGKKPESKLHTAMRRALFALGDPELVINDAGKIRQAAGGMGRGARRRSSVMSPMDEDYDSGLTSYI